MKRLFVSDLDGTLLNSDARLSDTTVEILNREIENGIYFTISTARTPATALQIVKQLKLKLPIMMMNGVLVYDMQSGQYIKQETLSELQVMVLLGLIKTKGLSCFLYALEQNEFFAYYDSVDSSWLKYFRIERIIIYE